MPWGITACIHVPKTKACPSHLYLSGMLILMITAMSLYIIRTGEIWGSGVPGQEQRHPLSVSPAATQKWVQFVHMLLYIQCSWRQCESAHSLTMKLVFTTHSRLLVCSLQPVTVFLWGRYLKPSSRTRAQLLLVRDSACPGGQTRHSLTSIGRPPDVSLGYSGLQCT